MWPNTEVGSVCANPYLMHIGPMRNLTFAALLACSAFGLYAPLGILETRSNAPSGVAQLTLRGIVSDSAGTPVPDAEVSSDRSTGSVRSDSLGRFRLAIDRPGAVSVTVRRVGYLELNLVVPAARNADDDVRFIMVRATTLDTTNVTATRNAISSFEEHRKVGLGQFLTREQIAPREQSRTTDLLRNLRGARVNIVGAKGFLSTGRGPTKIGKSCNKEFEGARDTDVQQIKCDCYAAVFLDNQPYYRGREGEVVPDLNLIAPTQIESIEYYAGPSQTPTEYARLNSQCGVLVIHTRRSR